MKFVDEFRDPAAARKLLGAIERLAGDGAEEFDWLATRLEIARKLRNDPVFSRGWAERSAELAAATTDRLRRQKEAHRVRDDVPGDVLQCYLELVLDGLVARVASGEDPRRLAAVLDLVEKSVRRNDSEPQA